MSDSKRLPLAVCEICGHRSYRMETINERCSQVSGRKRCNGVMGSRLNITDWRECPTCTGSGTIADVSCSHCEGSGWFDNRSARW